jgi:hypothetical protein
MTSVNRPMLDLNCENFIVFGMPNTYRYTNHRGETEERRFIPHCLRYGATPFHAEPQWLLEVYDCDKNAPRTYALKDVQPC